MNITYKEIIDIAKYGLHTHVNNQSGTDICKICGEDLRHKIHFGMERFIKETDFITCMIEKV